MWNLLIENKQLSTMRLPTCEPSIGMIPCPAKVFSLRSRTWNYRGEGNANLVLAVPDEQVIVRLRKCPPSEAADGTRIWREVDFCRAVMRPLLGNEFVHVPNVVRLLPWEMEWLKDHLRPLRPRHRHHKSVFGELAAVFPDLCFIPASGRLCEPTFCVEIKPKQGWIPLADRRLPKCAFCLNQYLKLRNGLVSERSAYCPLDLFSGDPQKMTSAIHALVSCPQNNFKMFLNGTLQFDENNSSFRTILEMWFGRHMDDQVLLNNLSSVLIQALTRDFGKMDFFPFTNSNLSRPSLQQSRIPQHLLEKAALLLDGPSCYHSCSSLPPGCILSRILRLQQLDMLGSDEVHRLYSRNAHDQNDFDYVSHLVSDPLTISDPLHAYLLATTAKDCSILIAFQQVNNADTASNTVQDLNGTRYLLNIGVSDLDPKPMNCIEKHRKRDLEVVQSCIDWYEDCKRLNNLISVDL